jgi:Tol biopolymer transport system component
MKKIILLSLCFAFIYKSNAQYFGQNKARYKALKFKVAQSKNYELYHYFKNQDVAERILENSQIWHDKHKQIFGKSLTGKNPLIIYQNHPDFQETTAIDGAIGEGTGGVTEGLKNRVVMPIMYSHRQTDHVLGHELVHAFQYDMMRTGDSTQLENIQNLPLWMVEGLAEFMSIGRVDSHTAMWMRDAVQQNDIPNLKQIADMQKYFPYRWGQAFWAYISGTYGDAAIYPLFKQTAIYGVEQAIQIVLNTDHKKLFDDWRRVLVETYTPYKNSLIMEPVGSPVANQKNAGRMNIAPALSPNGKLLAYISEKNVISLDIYIADAETGKIFKKFNLEENRSHVDAINFLETAGSWSPGSDQLAYVIQSKGINKLMTINIASGKKTVHTVPGLDAFASPAWSPNGSQIVVSGLAEGASDLYLYTLETSTVKNITADINSDMMPAWSPDGKYVYFVTDRTATAARLEMADFNIARIQVATGVVENLKLFPKADNLNPQVDASGQNIYFLSDADGFRNLYRYNIKDTKIEKLTNFYTGVSGVTMYSPAISVAQNADRIVYSLLKNDTYELFSATSVMFNSFAQNPADVTKRTAILPPVYPVEHANIIQANLESDKGISNDADAKVTERDYKSKFMLDYIGTTGVGVGINQQYGAGLQGAVQGIFSDVLGNHQLQAALALQGDFKDFGGQAMYLNQKKPFQWGFNLSHIPYTMSGQGESIEEVEVSDGKNTRKVQAYKQSTVFQRQFNEVIDAFAFYPFNTHVRLEAGAGLNWVSFRNDRIDEFFDLTTEQPLGTKKEKLPADDRYNFQMIHAAWVGDNSSFGLTSPLNGYRYRAEVRQIFGVVNLTNYLADFRKYKYLRPISLGARFMFNARNGKDAETQALQPLYVGFPGYVRGYYGRSLDRQLSNGLDFNQLQGTRMAMANLELRLPFTGPPKLSAIKSKFLFTDLALFADVGGAWKGNLLNKSTVENKPATTTPGTGTTYLAGSSSGTITDRFRYDPVASLGAALRLNLFGYLVLEPYYALPIHSGKIHKGGFGLNLTPGW